MPIRFEALESRHLPATRAFNARLMANVADPVLLLPETFTRADLASPVCYQHWVAVDGDDVRGGYLLQWRDFWVDGERKRVCAYQSPISEGIFDRKYAALGLHLIRHALSVNPLLYTVGMGGLDRPLPKILKSLGFGVTSVPFLFLVIHGARFLREIRYLRTTRARRILLDALGCSGLASLAATTARSLAAVRGHDPSVRFREVPNLDEAAARVWASARGDYSLAAVRDSEMLRGVFPEAGQNFHRLEAWRGDRLAGWAVVLDKQMNGHRYFGNARLGLIADCFGRPQDAAAVTQAATAFLVERGVDVAVGNFQHPAWIAACRRAGYLPGPSNHGFTLSRGLVKALPAPIDSPDARIHLTRSESDGLVNV